MRSLNVKSLFLFVLLFSLWQSPQANAESRCKETWWNVQCDRNTTPLYTGMTGLVKRNVHWQVPVGTPPAEGWPAVVLYQPSLASADLMWNVPRITPVGAVQLTRMIQTFLDNGYAVLTPVAHVSGFTFWDTNVPPFSVNWELAPDHFFVQDILKAMNEGAFGPLDMNSLFATGMSSGGYMTSRMAVSYPGVFKALVISSASYATCTGILCFIPQTLPSDHPPTLFIHGDQDIVVPIYTMRAYADALQEQGAVAEKLVVKGGGHRPFAIAPQAALEWFNQHR